MGLHLLIVAVCHGITLTYCGSLSWYYLYLLWQCLLWYYLYLLWQCLSGTVYHGITFNDSTSCETTFVFYVSNCSSLYLLYQHLQWNEIYVFMCTITVEPQHEHERWGAESSQPAALSGGMGCEAELISYTHFPELCVVHLTYPSSPILPPSSPCFVVQSECFGLLSSHWILKSHCMIM